VAERELADYYEVMARASDPKLAANWLNNEILGRLNRDGRAITDCPVSAAANSAILAMIADGTISGKIAKDVLDIAWSDGGDPRRIVEERGLRQVTDTHAIETAVAAVIAANPQKVEEVKAKPKLIGWFVGQVMKETGGKANPQAVNAVLRERLALPDEG
jgi:aspartyl-tRNA(Asn)/glutamyl-tRNA(Gln) amidotransferase subunit B